MDKFVVPAALITAAIYLLTEGISSIAKHFGKDLGGRAAMLAAVIVGLLVGVAQAVLPLLSVETQTAIVQVLVTCSAIVMAFGLNDTVKGLMPPGKP